MRQAIPEFDKQVQLLARESIHALHEIKSIIGTILKTAESWIWQQSGRSLGEKVENAPEPLRKIHKSAGLLSTLLQYTDVIANPESATFGQPQAIPVVDAIFFLMKIFADRAAERGIVFRLRGRADNKPELHHSFIIVPFALLDNAIKHSVCNTQITIEVSDTPDCGVEVDISSQGRLVPDTETERIFSRGYRGSNALAKGSGLGLHVAQTIAKANGFWIVYRPQVLTFSPGQGHNHFIFRMPPRAPSSNS